MATAAGAFAWQQRTPRGARRRSPLPRRADALRRAAGMGAIVAALLWLRAVDGLSLLTGLFVLAACALWSYRSLPELAAGFAAPNLVIAGWLWSLARAPKVCELFSWSDPLPFLLFWARRLRSALSRRMHRWLATAS